MLNNWIEAKIEAIKDPSAYSIAMGPFGSNIKTDNFVSSGVPIIRGTNLNADRFVDDGFVFLTEQKADELKSANAFPGDLVFTHRGTLGQVGIIPLNAKYRRYVVSQSQMKLRCNPEKADPNFVYYFFKSPQGQYALLANTSTTGVPAISSPLTSLRGIKIPLPPLPEQHAIAGILCALDDKIELNRRMNATLESFKRVIFKSWFIDFDPVHAKAGGNNPIGMNTEMGSFFPSSFDGNVPKGWKVTKFGDFLFPSGIRIGSKEAPEYSATVNGLSLRENNFNKVLSKSKEKNKKIVRNNLVFGLSRQTINFGVMKEDIGSVSPVYEIFNVDSNVYLPELLEMFIRQKMAEYINILKPASREGQSIDRKYLLSRNILIPDIIVQKQYQSFCSIFNKQIKINENESATLASLRDALLPKLMRGEVRVKLNEEENHG
jgi:type I restriction enzyme, S subunit